MHSNFKRSAAILLVLAAVGGCGGGGGGTSNAGGGPAGPAPVATVSASGLVPDAPAAGALLYADAAPLRVLREGAVWTYRSVKLPNGEGTYANGGTAYTHSVLQAAASAGVVENHAYLDGSSTIAVRFEGGSYKSTIKFIASQNAAPLVFDRIELRSPVRVNDQYVSLDKHIADSGADYDGDKINDAMDVTFYSRVIGEEVVDLPNRRQVKAVRVDMTFRTRVTASATRTHYATYELVESTWYAPGIGIVKVRQTAPGNTQGAPNSIFIEVLENWDGLTEGLGHTELANALVPASSPLAGSVLGSPFDAVGFDTHAVVATRIPGQAAATGFVLAQLDARGKVVAARSYTAADLFSNAQDFREPRFVRIGNELRVLAMTGKSISVAALDATGQHIVRPALRVMTDLQMGFDGQYTSYRVAADSTGIWLAWVREPAAESGWRRSLVVQHFDGNLLPLSAAHVVSDPLAGNIGSFNMALDGTRLAVAWQEDWSLTSYLAMVDTGSATLVDNKRIAIPAATCTHVETLSLRPGLAITCWDNTPVPAGVAPLDADGNPMLAANAMLKPDMLRGQWHNPIMPGITFVGTGGQLFASAPSTDQYWPEDPSATDFTSVFQANGSNGLLAASEPVLLARIVPRLRTQFMVKLGNRLLLVGSNDDGYLNAMGVWLPR